MADKNYNQLLTELKKYNNTSNLNIYVPSAGKYVSFKPLTVKQQTDIINGVLNAQRSKNIYAYQNIIDNIIIDNCDNDDRDGLLSLDRACILIQFRLDTMGETLEINGQTYNLNDHVDTFKSKHIDISTIESVHEYEGISVECYVPTIRDETKVNKDITNIFKNTTDDSAVGEIFLIELTKHIKSVEFDKNEIFFEGLTLKQQVHICEMLPMALSQQVVKYIEAVRSLENAFTNIDTEEGNITIPIDSQLFNK